MSTSLRATTFPVYAALKFDSFDQDCFEVDFGDKTKVEVCYIFSLGDGIFKRLWAWEFSSI